MNEKEVTYFGVADFRNMNKKFGIQAIDRMQHVYVIGQTGVGKSTLLENMAVQDITEDKGMAFLDPHGGTAELLLEYIPEHRRKDVVYFAPFDSDYPISFNVMESVDNADQRSKIANGLMSVFKKIWVDSFSARMEYIMSNSILALLETPGTTLLGLNRILVDKDYRKMVIENITDASVKSFWVDEYLKWDEKYAREAGAAIQNKIGQFTSNPIIRNIVGQADNALDIRKIMDEGKILICNLSKGRLGEQNARLIGGMLNTKIYQAAMSRAEMSKDEIDEAKEFYLYVDEFQNFASDSFADVLSEARKYKLSLTIAHQYIAQMPENVRDAIFGNCGTLISFRIGPVDAEIMSQQFAPVFEPEDFANLGRFQIYLRLLVDRVGTSPFSANTLAPIEKPLISIKQEVIENSRIQYGRPKAEVEANITEWFQPVMTKEREDHLKYVAEKKAEIEEKGGIWVDYNDPKYKGMSKEDIKARVEKEVREKKAKQKEAMRKAKERGASGADAGGAPGVIDVEVAEKKGLLAFDVPEPPKPSEQEGLVARTLLTFDVPRPPSARIVMTPPSPFSQKGILFNPPKAPSLSISLPLSVLPPAPPRPPTEVVAEAPPKLAVKVALITPEIKTIALEKTETSTVLPVKKKEDTIASAAPHSLTKKVVQEIKKVAEPESKEEAEEDLDIVIMETEYIPPEEPKAPKKWDKTKKKKRAPDKDAYDTDGKRFRVSRSKATVDDSEEKKLSDSEIETQVLELQKKRMEERGFDESEALLDRIQGGIKAKLNPALVLKKAQTETPDRIQNKKQNQSQKTVSPQSFSLQKSTRSTQPRKTQPNMRLKKEKIVSSKKKTLPLNKNSRDRGASSDLKALLAKVATKPGAPSPKPDFNRPTRSSMQSSEPRTVQAKPRARQAESILATPPVVDSPLTKEPRRISNQINQVAPTQPTPASRREVPEDLLKSILE